MIIFLSCFPEKTPYNVLCLLCALPLKPHKHSFDRSKERLTRKIAAPSRSRFGRARPTAVLGHPLKACLLREKNSTGIELYRPVKLVSILPILMVTGMSQTAFPSIRKLHSVGPGPDDVLEHQ